MGNKSTREMRERLELYEADKEKRQMDVIIDGQKEVYDQMVKLARFIHLEKLNIKCINQVCDLTPLKDGLQCAELAELVIEIKDSAIHSLDCFPELEQLERFQLICKNGGITTILPLSKMISNNHKLKYLMLDLSYNEIDSLKSFDLHQQIEMRQLIIEVGDSEISTIDGFLEGLGRLTKLEELKLNFQNTPLTEIDSIGNIIKNCDKLLQLFVNLNNTQISSVLGLMSGISHLKNIRQLTLLFNDTQIDQLDYLGDALKYCSHLEYLNLQLDNTQVTTLDNVFTKLGYITSIKSLSLSLKNTKIPIQSLNKTLDTLSNLTYLKLSLNSVNDTILEIISQQSSIKTLILDLNGIEINSLNSFTNQLPTQLRHFHLLLSKTQLDEINWGSLSKISNLRTFQLDLRYIYLNYPIHSDSSIKRLIGLQEEIHRLSNLNTIQIDLRGTKLKLQLDKSVWKYIKYCEVIEQ